MAEADGEEVIAVVGIRPPAPWVLLESSTFAGRYYFFNTISLESQWGLPASLFAARSPTVPESGDAEGMLTSSLQNAREAVGRMEARYGSSSPQREGRPNSQAAAAAAAAAENGEEGEAESSSFSKRGRDLDPRLMSIDLEEHLTSALNQAERLEKKWSQPAIPEDSISLQNLPKPAGSGPAKDPTATTSPRAPAGDSTPSAESFQAMLDFSGEDEDPAKLYTVLNGLGSGGYSNVLLVRHTARQELLAMKVLSKRLLKRDRDRARLKNELRALTEIPPSPFIERCFAAFESPSHVCFVTEYLGGGDLFFHLTRRVDAAPPGVAEKGGGGFSEDEARVLLAEIVLGLEHMHLHNFIHCDIKVENIMLDAKGHVKLIDFGLSQEIEGDEEKMSPIGSLIYMAPELLTKGMGGRHTDWWAVGVLAHEMMTGRSPWSSLTDKKLIKKQIKTLRLAPPASLSPGAGDFVCGLLVQECKKRLGTKAGAAEIKAADFFTGGGRGGGGKVDWGALEQGTAAPALTPPRVAFIQEECDNALRMYQAADVRPADWNLGVEVVQSMPVLTEEAESAAALTRALEMSSLEDAPPAAAAPDRPPRPPPTRPPPEPVDGGGGGGGVAAASSPRGRRPRSISPVPPPAGKDPPASGPASGGKSSSGPTTRKGATPRASRPKRGGSRNSKAFFGPNSGDAKAGGSGAKAANGSEKSGVGRGAGGASVSSKGTAGSGGSKGGAATAASRWR